MFILIGFLQKLTTKIQKYDFQYNPSTKITTNSDVSVSSLTVGNLVLLNGSSPCFGKIIIGDGSGWSFNMSKKTAGEITDLFTFKDNGELHTPRITLDDGNGNLIGHALISSASFLSNNNSGWNYLTFKNGSALQGAIEMTPSKKLTHYVTNDFSVQIPILSVSLDTTEIKNNLIVTGNINGVSPSQLTALADLASLIKSGTCIIAPNGIESEIVSITTQGIYDIDIFNTNNGSLSFFKFTYFNGVGRLYTIFSDAMITISYNSLTHFLTGITYISQGIYINWNHLKKNNNLLM
jgi:hypothetical protein